MSLETLELSYLSQQQRQQTRDGLSDDQRQTLEGIEEEVITCQRFLNGLETMEGGVAEVSLPTIHSVMWWELTT